MSVASDKGKGNIIFAKQTAKASHLWSCSLWATDDGLSQLPPGRCTLQLLHLPWAQRASSYMEQWVTAWLLQGLLQNAPLQTALRHLAIHLCWRPGCDAWNISGTELGVSGLCRMPLRSFQIPSVLAFKSLPIFIFPYTCEKLTLHKEKKVKPLSYPHTCKHKNLWTFSPYLFSTKWSWGRNLISYFLCFFFFVKNLFTSRKEPAMWWFQFVSNLTPLGHSYGKDSKADRVHLSLRDTPDF